MSGIGVARAAQPLRAFHFPRLHLVDAGPPAPPSGWARRLTGESRSNNWRRRVLCPWLDTCTSGSDFSTERRGAGRQYLRPRDPARRLSQKYLAGPVFSCHPVVPLRCFVGSAGRRQMTPMLVVDAEHLLPRRTNGYGTTKIQGGCGSSLQARARPRRRPRRRQLTSTAATIPPAARDQTAARLLEETL